MDLSFDAFTAVQWAAILVIALIAGLMQGFVGIGFPLLGTPLMALVVGFKPTVIMLVLPTLVMIFCTLFVFRQSLSLQALKRFWPLLIMTPIGTWLGVAALQGFPARWLMVIMVAMLCAFLLLDWLGHTESEFPRRHPLLLAFPFGLMAGFCEGAINVAGPVLLIYFLLLDMPVSVIIAVLNVLFLLGKTWQSTLMAQQGMFTPDVLQAAAPLAVLGVVGYFTGLNLRKRFDPARYRGWLKATIGLAALTMSGQVLLDLFRNG
ncbi:MAG: sulfite exporter TauE/SafE family protein [Burkholderiales bacterium]|nr:sulfite exporter TauE/SafE family protein [Burkholderiales bacterium]